MGRSFAAKQAGQREHDGFGIELQTPDQFVLSQIMLSPARALAAIKKMRERWQRPEMTAKEMVALFEQRQLGQTASHLMDALDLI